MGKAISKRIGCMEGMETDPSECGTSADVNDCMNTWVSHIQANERYMVPQLIQDYLKETGNHNGRHVLAEMRKTLKTEQERIISGNKYEFPTLSFNEGDDNSHRPYSVLYHYITKAIESELNENAVLEMEDIE